MDFDELHAYENSKLIDVAVGGLGQAPPSPPHVHNHKATCATARWTKYTARAEKVLEGNTPTAAGCILYAA